MQTSSSANRTCSECSSASEYTATVLMPSSRHAKMTRSATSPRFAIRIFLNMASGGARSPLLRLDGEQALAVLHRLPGLDVDVHDLAVVLRVDLVHQLHRLDDAEHLSLLHRRADVDKRRRAGFWRAIKGADDRRFDDRHLDVRLSGGDG